MQRTVREVRAQLEKSKRGERKLRRAVESAERVYSEVMGEWQQCPIYTSPVGHPGDAWLAHHINAQQQ